jgi:hypothetical protein
MTKRSTARRPEDWQRLPDEELLRLRVRDLGLTIAGSPLAPRIQQLYDELDARGIRFHPPCYLASEWLCPDRVPLIGIPFYLAHPRLKQLERRMMLEVEGGTDTECLKLLRHEAGHAWNYAYRLYARTRWRQLFGPFSSPYIESYFPRPYSKRFVLHLEHNYAQMHPDEDFAETFAVVVTPNSNWRRRYRGWPAMKKLRYVERLIERVGPQPPRVAGGEELYPAARMTSTLAMYYERRRRLMQDEFLGFYDPGLQRLFAGEGADGEAASAFLRRWRKHLVGTVCTWTGDRKYDVNALMGLLVRRSGALRLRVAKPEAETAAEVAAFVTAAVSRIHRFQDDDAP